MNNQGRQRVRIIASEIAIARAAPPRTIVMIHGMWSTPAVWDNYRRYFEEAGYRVMTPRLRHHDASSSASPHSDLGATSVLDYADDLEAEIRTLDEIPFVIGHSMGGFLTQLLAARGLAHASALLASAHCAPLMALRADSIWIFRKALFSTPFWRSPQKPDYETMRWGILNGMSSRDADALYSTLVPESGRTLLELALWFLDGRRAGFIARGCIKRPMLFLTGENDRLTPPALCMRNARYHGDVAQFELLPAHAHWLPSEPGWEKIAARIRTYFEAHTLDKLRVAA